MLLSWHKSGFNVHFGDVIPPEDKENREKAAWYLVKPPISVYKMAYDWKKGKVIYGNPNGEKKVNDDEEGFDEWVESQRGGCK